MLAEADGEGIAEIPVHKESEKEFLLDRSNRQIQEVEVDEERGERDGVRVGFVSCFRDLNCLPVLRVRFSLQRGIQAGERLERPLDHDREGKPFR